MRAPAISAEARKNHDEMFPGHVSTLSVTDPELIESFDNLAFDEVRRYGSLDTRTRLMVQLASLIACQGLSEYRVMLGAALTVGVTPVEVKEIVYQAVPYVGMAKVFDFLHATNDVLTDRGVELPLPGQSTTTPDTFELVATAGPAPSDLDALLAPLDADPGGSLDGVPDAADMPLADEPEQVRNDLASLAAR